MSERSVVNCEVCNSFLHKTKDCVHYERLKGLLKDTREMGLIEGLRQGLANAKHLQSLSYQKGAIDAWGEMLKAVYRWNKEIQRTETSIEFEFFVKSKLKELVGVKNE